MELTIDKKFIVRAAILSLVVVYFGGSIIVGKTGLLSYFSLKKEIRAEKEKVDRIKQKIEKLSLKIQRWQQDDFELEKLAREDLQMGLPDEKVYLLK
jgi:cell division protein FtsB